jgi:hypothetical protein
MEGAGIRARPALPRSTIEGGDVGTHARVFIAALPLDLLGVFIRHASGPVSGAVSSAAPPLGYLGLPSSSHIRAQYLVHAGLVAGASRSEKSEHIGVDPQGDLPLVRFGNQRTHALPRNAMRGGYVRKVDILVGQPRQARSCSLCQRRRATGTQSPIRGSISGTGIGLLGGALQRENLFLTPDGKSTNTK